jgi:hypothetical protein
LYLSGRFLHEAEVEANQKQAEMDEATNAQKVRGHCSESKLENVLPDAFHTSPFQT